MEKTNNQLKLDDLYRPDRRRRPRKVIQERVGSNAVVIHDRQAIANDVSKHAGKKCDQICGDVGLVSQREAALPRSAIGWGARERAASSSVNCGLATPRLSSKGRATAWPH